MKKNSRRWPGLGKKAIAIGIVAGFLSIGSATAAYADDFWSATKTCVSPALSGQLNSSTSGFTEHRRSGSLVATFSGGNRHSTHPLGTYNFAITAPTIYGQSWSCPGA